MILQISVDTKNPIQTAGQLNMEADSFTDIFSLPEIAQDIGDDFVLFGNF